ncbi:MAG: hypothetical protein IT324_28935 [Anaerolineae bacterium]|nr:hypothetical protein [Anaerolineae bacterium]
MSQTVIPRFKLIMRYDINPGTQEAYFQFVTGEFVPALQSLGVYMLQVYHTAYGDQPVRQLEFVSEDIETIRKAMKSELWNKLMKRFNSYTSNYSQKIVKFRDGFQL